MRKSNANAIFLFLILLIVIMSFASASFNIGKGNKTLATYSPGAYLSGYLNISFQNQSLNKEIQDNQGNKVSLIELLNSSMNQGYIFNCDIVDCENNYQSIEKLSSKTYNLAQGEKILFGIEFTGILYAINSVQFTISSNAGEACESQLKIDILDDGTSDFSNSKASSSVCSGNYTGCYSASTGNDVELLITNTPLCQKINLSEASGYQLGAWIAEKTAGASSIKMSIYNKAGTYLGACNIAKAGMSTFGGEFYCNISYLTTEVKEHYVCLYSEGTGGEYKTKGYSLAKGCGFSGLPPKNGTAAYYIFAKPKKFGAVESLNIGDSLTNGQSISQFAVDYITETYGTNDCTNGCYVPISVTANVAQNITIKNFSIKYDKQDLPGIEDNKMHVLEKVPAKINSDYQYLFVDNLFKLPTKLGNLSYSMTLDGQNMINTKIRIKNISISLTPTKVPIAVSTLFKINIVSDSVPVRYFWAFDNDTKETLTNQISYTYLKEGNHEIIVGIQTSDGGVFSKTFTISVQSSKETSNKTLTELETNIKTINNQIMNLDSFTKAKIIEDLNLTYIDNQIKILRIQFNKATNEADYIQIINELNQITLPEAIIQTSTNYVSYYPETTDIDLDSLVTISMSYYDKENAAKYIDAILYWNQLNLDTKISMKEISYKYDSNLIPLMKTFSLQFTPKEYLDNDTYLIIGYLENLQFNTNFSQKEGYAYTKINGKTSVSFSTTSDVDFIGLPLFISPSIDSLPVFTEEITEHKTPWWILAIIFAVVIIIAFIVYLILRKWYDKKYEKNLFPNRNNLYNLITYINNQKAKGVPEEDIKESLRKAKWSNEQIRYVVRKYLGKNTGMWKLKKSQEIKEAKANSVQFNKKIKKRSIALHIILGIITLGIYWVIWLFISSHELRKINKKAPSIMLILLPLILSILYIIAIFFSFITLNFLVMTSTTIIGFIIAIILGISWVTIYIKYSKALSEITGFSLSKVFVLLLLVYPIGTIVSQVQLNKKAN